MQPGRTQRAPGSFSPLPVSVNASSVAAAAAVCRDRDMAAPSLQPPPSRPQIRRIDTSSSVETTQSSEHPPHLFPNKKRSPVTATTGAASTTGLPFTTYHANRSTGSLHSQQGLQNSQQQNHSRSARTGHDAPGPRTTSPLVQSPGHVTRGGVGHARKYSQTQGMFEPSLPSTTTSNLSSHTNTQQTSSSSINTSQIAAQAAMHQQHTRHRSQTVPFPGSDESKRPGPRPYTGGSCGNPLNPPLLSLTEASVPREGGFCHHGYHNGLLGSHTAAAASAANAAFPRVTPQPSATQERQQLVPSPVVLPEKPAKVEKEKSSKVKLFSRPKKIDTKDAKVEKPVPSPSKIGSALASLQRTNHSTASLAESQSMYNLNNSSVATIRPSDAPVDTSTKEKERKHHFLSRGKHKSAKDDYHLPLSSAASNSRPVDPSAPSSLYNFNLPPSPVPTSTSFHKSVSGLDLRHGGRALREKRKEDRLGMTHENESVFTVSNNSEWLGPCPMGPTINAGSSFNLLEPWDSAKYGLHNMTLDDAWPYLKAKLLVIFEGEDLRLPIEDFNRVVTMHIQWCLQRRSAHMVIEDLRELLGTGFASLDHSLRRAPEDRLVPALVEVWMITFTRILPYMQAVFLPLDLEFSGAGPLLSPEQARDFWATVIFSSGPNVESPPPSAVLDVRRLVLLAFRDTIILPRYDKLKTIFSRLSLEQLPSSLAGWALASPPTSNEPFSGLSSSPRDEGLVLAQSGRPSTAMSLDPSVASYNSSSSTLFGEDSNPSRSRAISNVSFGSGVSDGVASGGFNRSFAPNGRGREQNAEDSKQITDMVGRMLQCMSVLASVGSSGLDPSTASLFQPSSSVPTVSHVGPSVPAGPAGPASAALDDAGGRMITELCRLLKLNWLGRGRTGRNRRGIVGGRVKREEGSSGQNDIGLGVSGAVPRDGFDVAASVL